MLDVPDVVILTGGQGSRLRSLVSDRPKTMARFHGRPFLDLLIGYLRGGGFRRFILCVGYMADYIIEYYTGAPEASPEILFSKETIPLGTGGAVRNAAGLITGNSFIVMNGDSFCPVDFPAFAAFHREKGADLSMVLSPCEKPEDFGSVVLDASNRIIGFSEKIPGGNAWINAGVYLFSRKVLASIPPGRVSLEYDVFPRFAGKEFYGFSTMEKVMDIGTPARLEEARKLIKVEGGGIRESGSNRNLTCRCSGKLPSCPPA